jgi:hypothetical protein
MIYNLNKQATYKVIVNAKKNLETLHVLRFTQAHKRLTKKSYHYSCYFFGIDTSQCRWCL